MPHISWKAGRKRERYLCLDLHGELSIYNSQSCLRGLGVNVMDALSDYWRFSVLGSFRTLWARANTAACPFVIFWSLQIGYQRTVILQMYAQRHPFEEGMSIPFHKGNWHLAPPLGLATQLAMHSDFPFTPVQLPWVIKHPLSQMSGTLKSEAKIIVILVGFTANKLATTHAAYCSQMQPLCSNHRFCNFVYFKRKYIWYTDAYKMQ